MGDARFDLLIRSRFTGRSRRSVFAGLASGLSAILPLACGGEVAARKKRKNTRKKPLRRNSFGCVNVGGTCRGNSANCCSGICQGKKPRKGKKDRSRCVAHNALDCPAGADFCQGDDDFCGTGFGRCYQTTGQASFCGSAWACIACTKDTDCEPVAGVGAACIVCPTGCPQTGTNCAAAPL
jgi:hypothetical protein